MINKTVSLLVVATPDGEDADADLSYSLQWVHWDDLGEKMGRVTSIQEGGLKYVLPYDKKSLRTLMDDGRATVLIGSIGVGAPSEHVSVNSERVVGCLSQRGPDNASELTRHSSAAL